MTGRIAAPQVGAPDPEKRNSMILDEAATDDLDGVDPDSVEFATCQFNGVSYGNGAHVCSGDELLRCERGKWLRSGTCEPDNP
ncbi:MAG TPA: hypothetical protein VIQ22_03805 [Gammaproteobacteria bacterium]